MHSLRLWWLSYLHSRMSLFTSTFEPMGQKASWTPGNYREVCLCHQNAPYAASAAAVISGSIAITLRND